MDKIDLSKYDGQIIDEDAYYGERREQALKNAQTREGSYPIPKDWYARPNATHWADCIATATSNYGKPCTVTGNLSFYAHPEQYGFRRMNDDEASMPGDIIQAYNSAAYPYHAFMVNSLDKDGKIATVNYSDGSGVYYRNVDNAWKNSKTHRYRYIGTPSERKAIEEHNNTIRNRNAPPAPLESPVQAFHVQPVTPNIPDLKELFHQRASVAERDRNIHI